MSIGAVVRKLREKYSVKQIKEIIRLYADAYGNSGMSAKEVLEEIVCDAMGQMNAFATESTKSLAGEVGVFLRDVRSAAQNSKITGTKKAAGEGSVKSSIEFDALGRKYVQATRQVIEGTDPGKWGKQIENYINQEIRKGEDVLLPTDDGHILLLTGRSAYKLSDRHKQDVKTKVRDVLSDYNYQVKSRMATHIDELVKVGRFREYKPDYMGNHENDIGEDGFNYYDAYFRDFDGKYYVVPISAAINGNEETVYSIGNVQRRRYNTSAGSSSKGGARKNGAVPSGDSIVYSVGESQVQNSMREAFEKAQRENGLKFSREMDTVKALERQNELLKQRVEYWKGQTKRTTTQKADSAEVRKLARELLGRYDSNAKATEILNDLQWLADQWANGGSKADYTDMVDCANRKNRLPKQK